jgi:hypothetical protein
MAGPIPQIEGVDAHSFRVQNMINTGVLENANPARYGLESLRPVLLGTKQQPD